MPFFRQMQQLWEQLMRGTQSDQPQSKLPASALKHQLASRPGVNRLRKLGPKRAFAEFNMMADDASRGARDRDEMLTKMMLDVAKHSCSKPALELVSVAHEHPNPSVSYVPSSVLLARCSDRTGCCGDEVRSCASKTHVTIELPVLLIKAMCSVMPSCHRCQCTGEFAPRILPRGRCKCDCFVGNRKCKRIQRGRVHVSESDNR
ncbi:Placenta growth factor [Amphibalanus amphitrite]|uniref:Placenta growth factor n=1 Tax=Amphibalanus amphitrite TaxID=1232801 RepID=A0A6A4VWV4_AMPAM|nr:Placenta growth factor [Amphibalanus amphitrite]